MAKVRPKREGIMLCYPTEEGRVRRLGETIIIQPKIKGERAIVEWFGNEPVLISSYGNECKFLDHIKDKLKALYKSIGPAPLDGELYTHGWGQEQISGILRSTVNKHPDTEGLEYHIFDVRSTATCKSRSLYVFNLRASKLIHTEGNPLRFVDTFWIESKNWMKFANGFVEQGYEGAILRKETAPWEAKRTVNMLKFKPTEKDNYLVLKVNEAIDKEGMAKGMVGSFTVKAHDTDESFKVGAGKMKHSRRIELWGLRHLIPGNYVEVKHELIRTSGGVPVCAVAVDVIL